MLNQLLRFTLVSSALLWLRPRWRGLLALTVGVLLIHVLHGEYLGYVELSGNSEFLVWSYVAKWLALLASVVAYLLLAVYGLKPGVKPSRNRSARHQAPAGENAASPPETISAASPGADDGFDFLRHKKRLDSRADKVIAQKRG